MVSKKINVLAIGFNYQEINRIQDELGKEFSHVHFDFAISIRDSWYRLKFQDYDYLLFDLSDSDLDSIIATQEIIRSVENVTVIVTVFADEMQTISNALNLHKSCITLKDDDFATNLVEAIRTDIVRPKSISVEGKTSDQEIRISAKEILNAISDRILVVDSDYTVRFANKVMVKAIAMEQSTIIGKPCYQVCYQFDEPCHKKGLVCPLIQAMSQKQTFQAVHVHQNPHSDLTNRISISATPIVQEGNDVKQLLLNIRYREEKHVPFKDSQLLEALINGVSDGIFMIDATGRVVLHNQMVGKIFGKELNHYVGRSILDVPMEDASSWLAGILQNVKTQVHTTSNLKIQIKNKWFLLRYVPLYHDDSEYLGGFLYLTDISTVHIMDTHHQEIDRELFKITKYFPSKFIAEG